MINQHSSFFLEANHESLTLFSCPGKLPIFEVKEPILIAQGIAEEPNRIHLAYLKATGELCYSIISELGEHQTTTLGKLDTKTHRYDRLILLPVNRVIHIFYASSHLALPDVWRITHLLWNGQTWKSAQLGEVVHPRHPLYHVLLDSKSNLHLLMMTFLGSRSVLLSNFFNGSFHIWATRQETLSIPREVIDMAVLITSNNTGYVLWGAKQPGSDQFEVGLATQSDMSDFMSTWRTESNPLKNIRGPWGGLGLLHSAGVLNLLLNTDQERLYRLTNRNWNLVTSLGAQHSALQIIQKTESVINYTEWLLHREDSCLPVFAKDFQFSLQPVDVTDERSETMERAIPIFKTEVIPQPVLLQTNPERTEEAAPALASVLAPIIGTPTPPESQLSSIVPVENKHDEVRIARIDDLKDTLFSMTNDLQALGEKIETIPGSLQALIREEIEVLNQQNLKTHQALDALEEKMNALKAEQQTGAKKGFWGRWFTSMKK